MTDKWTIYRTDNGEVTGVIESPDPETVALNIGEDEAAIPGDWQPGAYYIADGEALPLPAKPGPWAVWTGEEWTDPRTEQDKQNELFHARSVTSLTKREFLHRCMEIGLLVPDEAAQAARGEIPDSFQSAFSQMSAMEIDEARIDWAAATTVDRDNQFILKLASIRQIAPETLDILFNVEVV